MTKQVISVGTTPNDRKGDSLRAAFTKINANFDELYAGPASSNPLTFDGGGASTVFSPTDINIDGGTASTMFDQTIAGGGA